MGIPPVLHMGSCVDNSRILMAATACIKAGGLGTDISDMPAAGAAPEWMSEKAISIGHYFVASGVYTMFGVTFPTTGSELLTDYLFKGIEEELGGKWDFEPDPELAAKKMIAHIDLKRKALGIDKARERVLFDMDMRREMAEAAAAKNTKNQRGRPAMQGGRFLAANFLYEKGRRKSQCRKLSYPQPSAGLTRSLTSARPNWTKPSRNMAKTRKSVSPIPLIIFPLSTP